MSSIRHSRLWSAWPLLASFGVSIAIVSVLFASIRDINGGYFGYWLDDAYIHMAIAKNFALNGVWGTTPYAFSAASSSPLWTMLLAGWYKVFGVGTLAPFVFSSVFGAASLVVAWRVLLLMPLAQVVRALTLLAALLFSQLPLLVFSGMEHALHLFLELVFLLALLHVLQSKISSRVSIIALLATVPLLMVTRFESFGIVFIASLLFMVRRRWTIAALVLIASSIGPVLVGLWTTMNGGAWLPNSVIIKGLIATSSTRFFSADYFQTGLQYIFATPIPGLLILLLAGYFWLRKIQKQHNLTQGMVLLIIASSLMPLQTLVLARTPEGRYFDNLLFLALLACAAPLWDALKSIRGTQTSVRHVVAPVICIGLIMMMVYQLTLASVLYYRYTPLATKNIYEQQHQMGRFFARFYEGRGVALNDIGEVSFQADIHLLDVWGLADTEVMRLRLGRRYTPDALAALARERRVAVAVVYDGWFSNGFIMNGGVPKEWVKVGGWTIQDNIVAAFSTVDFYAVDPAESEQLALNLRTFGPELPAGVTQRILTTE